MPAAFSLLSIVGTAAAIDCSTNACQSGCECAVANCGAEIDACSADPTCAAGQDCYAACACGDTDCVVACATAHPSAENGPYFDCMNANCPSKAAPAGIDCSTNACQSGCECAVANCGAEIDACSADSTCAAGQDCYAACACGDTDCVVACATAHPSAENGPYFDCMNANCPSKAAPAWAKAAPAGIDCSTNACQSGCECALANCGAEIDACSADSTCAAGQDCYAACACGDTDCVVACATAYPSAENGPYFDCMNANCPSKEASAGIDCSTNACQSGCECALANCGAEIDACSADSTCAAGQDCYAACACGDTDCVVACATAHPSAENGPYFDCMNANCPAGGQETTV